jgi:aryl carrier-like protein
VEYLGRVDHQVKIRGFRIELGEIEAAVKKHPGISECVVIAREDTSDNDRLVAYIVRKSPATSEIEPELTAALRKVLPKYMVPSHIVTLPAMPRTANGKLDRAALPAPSRSATRPNDNFVAPKTTLERKIATIWEELLQVERVSVTDNFFDLGGHSLLGLRLVNQLREMVAQPVPFTIMFEAPTVVEMAKLLEKNYAEGRNEVATAASTPLVAVNREARRMRRP